MRHTGPLLDVSFEEIVEQREQLPSLEPLLRLTSFPVTQSGESGKHSSSAADSVSYAGGAMIGYGAFGSVILDRDENGQTI